MCQFQIDSKGMENPGSALGETRAVPYPWSARSIADLDTAAALAEGHFVDAVNDAAVAGEDVTRAVKLEVA
jgi:hypothetical protein